MLAGTFIRGTVNGVREGRVAGRQSGRKSVLGAALYRSLRSSRSLALSIAGLGDVFAFRGMPARSTGSRKKF